MFTFGPADEASRLQLQACSARTTTRATPARVMDDIWDHISFGVGRHNRERVEHPILDEIAECAHPFQKGLAQLAASQLGTVGGGNHYVDMFHDEQGWLWIGVHFGSRGFGHKTCSWIFQELDTKDGMDVPPVVLPANSELGVLYIDAMERAGRYAYAGREWVVGKILSFFDAHVTKTVHNHHNFAWREMHFGQPWWVHRKGATPAANGQLGFVGSTMGEPSVILYGEDSMKSQQALYSTVHGAGRVMSRTAAAGKTKVRKFWSCEFHSDPVEVPIGQTPKYVQNADTPTPPCPKCGRCMSRGERTEVISAPLVDFQEETAKLRALGVELRGGAADEAPPAYKRLNEVLAYHKGTVGIMHTLTPIGVAMAGRETVDPYRD